MSCNSCRSFQRNRSSTRTVEGVGTSGALSLSLSPRSGVKEFIEKSTLRNLNSEEAEHVRLMIEQWQPRQPRPC